MFEPIERRYHSLRRRVRRIERRETRELRRWLEDTDNLLHLSVIVFVPAVIAGLTWLSNVSPAVSFLVYPPLASGTYTLFADPGGRYSSPRVFVGGMTAGALSGWVALELSARFWYTVPPTQFQVHAGAAALGIVLTALATWLFDLEEPTAFSAALLVLVTGAEELTYVAGLAVSSVVVAGVFVFWRRRFYHERARYLFQSTRGNDQLLVPIRGEGAERLAVFAAQLAAAHESGKLVLMTTVSATTLEETESSVLEAHSDDDEELVLDDVTRVAEAQLTERSLDRLERIRATVEAVVDIPCEFVVATEDGSAGETVLETAVAENCDLIVCPYEVDDDGFSPFVRTILSGETDAVVFRPSTEGNEWHRILVMVRSSGEVANAMLDFAHRLVTDWGTISACTCITSGRERRSAEILLETVVESFDWPIETRIAHGEVETFIEQNAAHYDLTVIGASTDRSAVTRFLSRPTAERVRDVDCDLAIVHRG